MKSAGAKSTTPGVEKKHAYFWKKEKLRVKSICLEKGLCLVSWRRFVRPSARGFVRRATVCLVSFDRLPRREPLYLLFFTSPVACLPDSAPGLVV